MKGNKIKDQAAKDEKLLKSLLYQRKLVASAWKKDILTAFYMIFETEPRKQEIARLEELRDADLAELDQQIEELKGGLEHAA